MELLLAFLCDRSWVHGTNGSTSKFCIFNDLYDALFSAGHIVYVTFRAGWSDIRGAGAKCGTENIKRVWNTSRIHEAGPNGREVKEFTPCRSVVCCERNNYGDRW